MDEDLSFSGKIGVSILIFLGFLLLLPLLLLFVILFYTIAIVQAVAAFVGTPRALSPLPRLYPRPHLGHKETPQSSVSDVTKQA